MLILQCIAAQPVVTTMSAHPAIFISHLSACDFLSTQNDVRVLTDYGTTFVSDSKGLRRFHAETNRYLIEVLTEPGYADQSFFFRFAAAIFSFILSGFCNLALDLEEAAFAAFSAALAFWESFNPRSRSRLASLIAWL